MDFDYIIMPVIIAAVGILVIWLSVRRFFSVTTKGWRTWPKVTELMFLSIVVLLVAALAGSSLFNAIALPVSRLANPPQGAFESVDGRRMHIDCMGNGTPTIVLDSGYGNDATAWETVQPELSKTTRVCSFDRAGSGWSEPQPGPRDADHIVGQLHQLLLQAKVSGPVVLMGHSIAGLYVRDYATHYPNDIAGIVFVDSSAPAQFQSAAFKAGIGKGPQWPLYRVAAILGIPRLLWMCSLPVPGLSAQAGDNQAEDLFHGHIQPLADEMGSFGKSAEETDHSGPYGSLPILIFSEDTTIISAHGDSTNAMEWNQLQEDLKKLSTRSRRIIARNSGHYIQIDRADLIEKEVPLFIEQIRGTAPQPTKYGSTTTE